MSSLRSFLLRSLLAAFVIAAMAGCSSLPPLPPHSASHALTDTGATRLGALESANLDQAGDGESGFRLLQTGDFAFDARLAIVRPAERSVDAQYYQIQKDGTGLRFLR